MHSAHHRDRQTDVLAEGGPARESGQREDHRARAHPRAGTRVGAARRGTDARHHPIDEIADRVGRGRLVGEIGVRVP